MNLSSGGFAQPCLVIIFKYDIISFLERGRVVLKPAK